MITEKTLPQFNDDERDILSKVLKDYEKYGIITDYDNGLIIYIPTSTDVVGKDPSQIEIDIKNACINKGIRIQRLDTLNIVKYDRHWSWKDYINKSSEDKVKEDLKDIKNQDLSLHLGGNKKNEDNKNDTVVDTDHMNNQGVTIAKIPLESFFDFMNKNNDNSKSKNTNDMSSKAIEESPLDIFGIEKEKSMAELIALMGARKSICETRDHMYKISEAHGRAIDRYMLLSKTISIYGVIVKDLDILDNDNMIIKLNVPKSSELYIKGKEACGSHIAKIVADEIRSVFEDVFKVSVKWKTHDIYWTVDLCASTSLYEYDINNGLIKDDLWYTFSDDSIAEESI